MQSPIIHQQLILSTERIRDLHRSMQAHSSAIPPAEMDVFLAEIRKMYELALQLHYHNALDLLNEKQLAFIPEPKSNSTHEIQVSASNTPPVIETPITASVSVNKPTTIEVETKKPEPVRKEEISESPVEVPSHMSMDKLMAEISKSETVMERNFPKSTTTEFNDNFEPTSSVAHTFEEKESLADRIAHSQHSNSVSQHLNRVPVKDIKASIGLNEKFQFINHLFNGDSHRYNAAVDLLNNCGSAFHAQAFMKDVSTELNWEKHPAQASLFMDIVERRHIA